MPDNAAHSELQALGTITLVAVFVCAWVPATQSAMQRVDLLDDVGGRVAATRGRDVAWLVVKVLFHLWVWLVLVVVVLLFLQKYLVNTVRTRQGSQRAVASVSKYGSLLSLSFGPVGKRSVVVSLVASVVLTYLFAWASMRRALARHPHEATDKRTAAIREIVGYSMTLNLVMVAVTVFVSGVFA